MASTTAKKDFQRLPTDVIPVNYCLELTPDLQAFTFAGRLRIKVDVKKATKEIKLNAAELKIDGAQFKKTLQDGWLAGRSYTVKYKCPVDEKSAV